MCVHPLSFIVIMKKRTTATIQPEQCQNPKCGHRWIVRVVEPQKCPKCGHRIVRKQTEQTEQQQTA